MSASDSTEQADQIERGEGADHAESASIDDPSAAPQTEPASDPIEVLQAEVEALRDQKLRAQAEVQNVRQRMQRDKSEAIKYAEADFARSLLGVLDDLERTIESAKASDDAQAVGKGVSIVYDQFLKLLKDRHIEPIDAVGKPFDPDLHEAVMQKPSEKVAAGAVAEVLARGYRMHARVIRPAKVIVSTGGDAKD